MHWGAWATQAPLGARANRSWLLSYRLSLATSPYPRIAFPRAPPYANIHEKGVRALFKGLMLRTSHTPRLRASTSTQENGSRWAAQGVGKEPRICRANLDGGLTHSRPGDGDGVPRASTSVACRAPVTQCRPRRERGAGTEFPVLHASQCKMSSDDRSPTTFPAASTTGSRWMPS